MCPTATRPRCRGALAAGPDWLGAPQRADRTNLTQTTVVALATPQAARRWPRCRAPTRRRPPCRSQWTPRYGCASPAAQCSARQRHLACRSAGKRSGRPRGAVFCSRALVPAPPARCVSSLTAPPRRDGKYPGHVRYKGPIQGKLPPAGLRGALPPAADAPRPQDARATGSGWRWTRRSGTTTGRWAASATSRRTTGKACSSARSPAARRPCRRPTRQSPRRCWSTCASCSTRSTLTNLAA